MDALAEAKEDDQLARGSTSFEPGLLRAAAAAEDGFVSSRRGGGICVAKFADAITQGSLPSAAKTVLTVADATQVIVSDYYVSRVIPRDAVSAITAAIILQLRGCWPHPTIRGFTVWRNDDRPSRLVESKLKNALPKVPKPLAPHLLSLLQDTLEGKVEAAKRAVAVSNVPSTLSAHLIALLKDRAQEGLGKAEAQLARFRASLLPAADDGGEMKVA